MCYVKKKKKNQAEFSYTQYSMKHNLVWCVRNKPAPFTFTLRGL